MVLTRLWCLWELYCTVATGGTFSICLGPADQTSFEAALLKDPASVMKALSNVDVSTAEISNDFERDNIMGTRRLTLGTLSAVCPRTQSTRSLGHVR